MKMFLLLALGASSAMAAPQWLTVDNTVLVKTGAKFKARPLMTSGDATVISATESEVLALSERIHHDLNRCGGFIAHDSLADAKNLLASDNTATAVHGIFTDYFINQEDVVEPLLDQVLEANIASSVRTLSSYHTRYYTSPTGVQSSLFIRDAWRALSAHRNDVSVELYQHPNWPQASVIMTITGSTKPNEIVILGGHADSTASDRAPGADDNASGIATITEVIRVLMDANFKPERTIQFMAYSAEEVGLRGSNEIAATYKTQNKNVVGVLQLDMTLFKGSNTQNISIINDYTNQAQNTFLGTLIDQYVKVPWGQSRCGYGCSDHASWTSRGYPASFSFEANFGSHNQNIHTNRDTIENSGGNANHAVTFGKLAIAFVIEIANK